jgi:hypothetical protein
MRAEPARLVWLTWQADAGAHECLIRKCACRRALERAAPSTLERGDSVPKGSMSAACQTSSSTISAA